MQSFVGYSWAYIGPNQTVGVYLHGFPLDQFAGIDIQPSNGNRPAFQPIVDWTNETTALHLDNTFAHTITVTNKSVSSGGPPTPFVAVVVLLVPFQ